MTADGTTGLPTSPYAPADPAASRRVRALAEGLHAVRGQALSASDDHARVAVALATLGLPSELRDRAGADDAFEAVAAAVLQHHGRARMAELHWWTGLALADGLEGATAAERSELALRLHGLARELGLGAAVGPALEAIGAEDTDPGGAISALRDAAVAALALDEGPRYGPVPGLSLRYPEAYRLAIALGELRAVHTLGAEGSAARIARELWPALDRLGAGPAIPDIDGLREPGPALWAWLEVFFAVGLGARSDVVFRAAHDRVVLGASAFRGVAFRRALGGLQQAARALRADALVAQLDGLAQQVDAADDLHAPPPSELADRVRRWLDAALPADGLEVLAWGRTLAWAHRFREREIPVDAPRIERFLAQFPAELRWVGEGLLDAVAYRTRTHVVGSLQFVLNAYGLSRQKGAVVIGGAPDGIAGFWDDLREAGLRLPRRPLSEALAGEWATLVLADDAVITGTRHIRALGAMLDGLDAAAREALAARDLAIVLGMATFAGIERLGSWLEEQGLRPRILVGHEEHLLSSLGFDELDAGTLLDAGGCLSQPGAQLAHPLFSAHDPVWTGQDHAAARDLCAEIGRALLGPVAAERGWNEARLRGSALGYGGVQGRHVFGHRVPRTTVTCLWCAGTWRGRAWTPLFPETP